MVSQRSRRAARRGSLSTRRSQPSAGKLWLSEEVGAVLKHGFDAPLRQYETEAVLLRSDAAPPRHPLCSDAGRCMPAARGADDSNEKPST
tara:strand:+ start:215 stop:484 length:270 start_codon:yes stop_codon:yes gene_type:complete